MAEITDSMIKKIVLKALSERFQGVKIVDVQIEAEDYIDGDRVLRISVVFDSKNEQIDSSATASVLRDLIPKFNEVEETGFPLMSYISKSELGNRKAEAG